MLVLQRAVMHYSFHLWDNLIPRVCSTSDKPNKKKKNPKYQHTHPRKKKRQSKWLKSEQHCYVYKNTFLFRPRPRRHSLKTKYEGQRVVRNLPAFEVLRHLSEKLKYSTTMSPLSGKTKGPEITLCSHRADMKENSCNDLPLTGCLSVIHYL